jgi:hypothetical protein
MSVILVHNVAADSTRQRELQHVAYNLCDNCTGLNNSVFFHIFYEKGVIVYCAVLFLTISKDT